VGTKRTSSNYYLYRYRLSPDTFGYTFITFIQVYMTGPHYSTRKWHIAYRRGGSWEIWNTSRTEWSKFKHPKQIQVSYEWLQITTVQFQNYGSRFLAFVTEIVASLPCYCNMTAQLVVQSVTERKSVYTSTLQTICQLQCES